MSARDWIRARLDGIQDTLIGAAVLALLGAVGSAAYIAWSAASTTPGPPQWIDRATGALVACAVISVLSFGYAAVRHYRRRDHAPVWAADMNDVRELENVLGECNWSDINKGASLSSLAEAIPRVEDFLHRNGSRFDAGTIDAVYEMLRELRREIRYFPVPVGQDHVIDLMWSFTRANAARDAVVERLRMIRGRGA